MYLIGKQVNLFTSKLFIPEVTQCLSPECLFDSLTVDSLSFALKPVGKSLGDSHIKMTGVLVVTFLTSILIHGNNRKQALFVFISINFRGKQRLPDSVLSNVKLHPKCKLTSDLNLTEC